MWKQSDRDSTGPKGSTGSFCWLLLPEAHVFAATRWVQKQILDAYPNLNLEVYAVWVPILRGDKKKRVSRAAKTLVDRWVVHYWDGDQQVGKWFRENLTPDYSGKVQWAAFFLYDRDAQWSPSSPPVEEVWGRTIIGQSKKLTQALRRITGKKEFIEE